MKWIRLLYTNISSCIMNNGVATPLFSIRRGVRQGDPLSPYLFILALETLLTAIKQNQDIKGIVVEDKEIKCIAFADDLTNLMRDKESYASLSLLLSTYGQCSGLKLNQDKKEAYWLGITFKAIMPKGTAHIVTTPMVSETKTPWYTKIGHRLSSACSGLGPLYTDRALGAEPKLPMNSTPWEGSRRALS